MFKKIITNRKILFLIDIILLIVSIKCYKYIFDVEVGKKTFTNHAIQFIEENKKPVFKISKIILYSSAYAVDNSENKQLEDIDISQYTDMAIYIDNKGKSEEITAENTINELFVDNIKVTINSDRGERILNYKNPKEFGKFAQLQNYENDGILFNVVHTQDEQEEADYKNNIFYTDCSNPITLGFINQNILTDCKINDATGVLAFDGSILKNANIDLESISGKINLSVHIKNNLGEEFVCTMDIGLEFEESHDGIYTGYVMKIQNTEGDNYNFLKVSE